MRQVILQYRRHCKDKKREWKISDAQFKKIAGMPCFYCGTKPERIKKSPHNTGDFVYNGLDRKDSTKGYTISNVVPCCRSCNLSKNDMTISEFAEWVRRVSAMSQQWGTLLTGGNLANSVQQPYADAIAQLETAA
jgi:5-methylcytosine-specific restriction endonuclease McrA